MKKLSLYVFLLLMFCNVGFAQCIKGDCNNGYGTYTWEESGSKYVGEWKDGTMHGHGTYLFPSGKKYVGDWKDANEHGQGTTAYPNGDKHVGEYKNGYEHGQGTFTYANGKILKGEWKNGDFVK